MTTIDSAALRDPDHRHCRKRRSLLPEPQSQRGELRIVRCSQEQEPSKILQRYRIHTWDIEPFRKRARPLLKITPGNVYPGQGVVPFLVAESELDHGRLFRLEEGQTRPGRLRFFDEQSESLPQLGGFDTDFDPGLAVAVGQQSTDCARIGLDPDPTSPNGTCAGASQNATA